MMLQFVIVVSISGILIGSAHANLDYFPSHDIDVATHIWSKSLDLDSNGSLNSLNSLGCSYCGELFYSEPPPSDILFLPPPPPHPSYQNSLLEAVGPSDGKHTHEEQQCNFCNIFYDEGEQLLSHNQGTSQDANHRIVALLIAFLSISGVLFVYLITTRRNKILASLTRTRLFESNGRSSTNINGHLALGKNSSINESLTNASAVHLSDPCYLQTNRDKNLTSPIINDHVGNKKTSIPSKYWAQPGSIIGRTIRRIPNEYEVPSSRTNSTGTSSAVYADMMANEQNNNQRFFSPYNLHTYAEVREVLDPNEHFHTSSNSSAMMSDSNYDNAGYSHGGCLIGNGAPNGSVQMSDFNSMRPVQTMTGYGQAVSINNHMYSHQVNQAKIVHGQGGPHQPVYEQPQQQRAQVIITSNNQGVNPTLLNYKERVHNVI